MSTALRRDLKARGLDTGGSVSHIIPVMTGTGDRAIELARALERRGFLTRAIRFPTVPRGSERIRLSLRSDFGEEALAGFAQVLGEEAGGDGRT
jgi:8-amino-7-oxononanoate synthase